MQTHQVAIGVDFEGNIHIHHEMKELSEFIRKSKLVISKKKTGMVYSNALLYIQHQQLPNELVLTLGGDMLAKYNRFRISTGHEIALYFGQNSIANFTVS